MQTSDIDVLSYCPNYICQMVLAAAFSVLRLSTSPLIEYLDALAAKQLFNSSITAVRKISITNNDIPGRLAEVLAQLKARRNRSSKELTVDWDSLQLKVRSRLSMSISFDSLWEWRRGFVEDENRAATSTYTISCHYLSNAVFHIASIPGLTISYQTMRLQMVTHGNFLALPIRHAPCKTAR